MKKERVAYLLKNARRIWELLYRLWVILMTEEQQRLDEFFEGNHNAIELFKNAKTPEQDKDSLKGVSDTISKL